MEPFVSIIIPVYNGEPYLRKCLDSLVNQTLKDIEIIVVDDGSTDNSAAILDEYASSDSRITIIKQSNEGGYSARNRGLVIAKGSFIGFVDNDDYVQPDMYEVMYDTAIKNSVDIVICGFKRCDMYEHVENEEHFALIPQNRVITHDEMFKLLASVHQRQLLPFVWRNIYRRSYLDDNSIKFRNLKMTDDCVFNLEAFYYANSVYALNNSFYMYTQNPFSSMGKKFKPLLEKDLIQQYENKIKFYKQFNLDVNFLSDMHNYMCRHHLQLLLSNAYNSDVTDKSKSIRHILQLPMIKNALRATRYIHWELSRGTMLMIIFAKIGFVPGIIWLLKRNS
ncbi:MAG: glycosyltransferase [Armatimonadota bacterium]